MIWRDGSTVAPFMKFIGPVLDASVKPSFIPLLVWLMVMWTCNVNMTFDVWLQRKGRAGRVQPGECYHLYPKCVYEAFSEYQLPELLRTPLNSLCLQIKSLQVGSIGNFLSAALQPPERLAVSYAAHLNAPYYLMVSFMLSINWFSIYTYTHVPL